MTATIDKVNRFLLVLIGLICLAGGVVVLLLSFRVFGDKVANQPMLRADTRHFADRNGGWFWLVVAIVAGVLALLALWWLISQATSQRVVSMNLEPDRERGHTKLSTGALNDALSEEVERIRGVAGASSRMLGKSSDPLLRLDVKVSDDGDLGFIRSRVEQEAISNARRASSQPQLSVWVRLAVGAESRRQVS